MDRSAGRIRPSISERASGSKGGWSPSRSTNKRGLAYAHAWNPHNLASGCDAGVPMVGKACARRAASRGQVLLLVDGGRTRERCLPPDPGKGMSGQAQVYRPLAAGKIGCTSPSPVVRGRTGGKVNARSCSGCGRACTKRLSALSIRGHAIGRWPRFEPWQGGSIKEPGRSNPFPHPPGERERGRDEGSRFHRIAQGDDGVAPGPIALRRPNRLAQSVNLLHCSPHHTFRRGETHASVPAVRFGRGQVRQPRALLSRTKGSMILPP
jgi:hypothetical protein